MRAFLFLLALFATPVAAQGVFPSYIVPDVVGYVGGYADAGDIDGDGRAEIVISGQDDNGGVYSRLYTFGGERMESTRDGAIFYLDLTRLTQQPIEPVVYGVTMLEDFDGDGRDELFITGTRRPQAPFDPIVALYRTDASGLPTPIPTGAVPPLINTDAALSRPYFAIAGRSTDGLVTRVFSLPGLAATASLPGVEFPALAWGDCDADGDADLAYSGLDAQGVPRFFLYRNDAGVFNAVDTDIPGTYGGGLAFADLDGDGAAELALTGSHYGPAFVEGITALYTNTGACRFTRSSESFPPIAGHSIAFGDVNRDGRSDLLIGGLDGDITALEGYVFVFSQQANGRFTLQTRQPGTLFGRSTWLDANGDSLLDILSIGRDVSGIPVVRIHRHPDSAEDI